MQQPILDAHQHFWHYHSSTHGWINDEMSTIRKDFLPKHLLPVYQQNNVDGCVAVQADQTLDETYFLLQLAQQHEFIKGVVGWIDLQADNIDAELEHLQNFSKLKGFRHILQGESPSFMLQPKFLNGISTLKNFNYTYDILIYPHQLSAANELVKLNPEIKFVIDHLAKPYIKNGLIDDWAKQIKQIANYSNVYCKISGLVTEADFANWQPEIFNPYLDVVVAAFGTKRLMFGSDWPVCLVAANYESVLQIVKNYINKLSTHEQADILYNNAVNFYNL
ncbi:MAG: amidohydrolase family protein [Chitinophagaceae bacterium]